TPDKRSFVFGLGTAAGSAGMFLFAPISQSMISTYGWSDTLVYFSIAMLIIPILAIPLIGNARSGLARAGEYEQSILEALREALGHRSYLLLTAGFFVCGFQLAFITVHFPPYIRDLGIDARYAVLALALIGFCNIIGSLAAGVISQRYSKPWFLTWIYLGRAISTAIFVLVPASPATVIAYSIVTGFLWLATVPPTNGLVAIMFGTRHLAMLGGVVFLSHQLGSFLGVWLGGYLYDHFGSYGPVWWLSVALAVLAAIVNWPIKEAPVARPALAPAA
ncbi:MFS transporter, partial [Salmonella enterica subsp. enterica]|nr:MFS transporter [Salmonella enterica subsp. enterica serovar Enteritidis]